MRRYNIFVIFVSRSSDLIQSALMFWLRFARSARLTPLQKAILLRLPTHFLIALRIYLEKYYFN
jgi:hypothetical protein